MRPPLSHLWRWVRSRLPSSAPTPHRPRPREWTTTQLTLDEATELLDLLERRGGRVVEVTVDDDARVTVRWVA